MKHNLSTFTDAKDGKYIDIFYSQVSHYKESVEDPGKTNIFMSNGSVLTVVGNIVDVRYQMRFWQC